MQPSGQLAHRIIKVSFRSPGISDTGQAHEREDMNAHIFAPHRTAAIALCVTLILAGCKSQPSAVDDAALGSQQAFVPGVRSEVADVQIMVKDSKKYASTAGWGFGKFLEGKPLDKATHEACFACHAAHVASHDFVFTRYAR